MCPEFGSRTSAQGFLDVNVRTLLPALAIAALALGHTAEAQEREAVAEAPKPALPEPDVSVLTPRTGVNSMAVEDTSLWENGDGDFVFHDNRPSSSNDPVPEAWNIYGEPLEFDAVFVYRNGGIRVDIDTAGDANAAVSSALDPSLTYFITLSSGNDAVTIVHQGDIADVTFLPDNVDEVSEFRRRLTAGASGTVVVSDEPPEPTDEAANSMRVEDTSLWADPDGDFLFHDNRPGASKDPVPAAWNIYGEPLEFDAVDVRADGSIRVDIDTAQNSNAVVSSALDPTVTYVITLSTGNRAVAIVHRGDIADVTILPDNANEVTTFHGQLVAGAAGTAIVSDETGSNATPVFTTSAAQSVAENTTLVVALAASDADGDALTFALAGGADQAYFALSDALLSFRSPPDYESPADANRDGTYEVTVRASDGRGGTASLALLVTVTDVADGSPPAAGSLRLVGGASASEGRLEVYLRGQWGTVCDDLWGDVDAAVACRQLGYASGEARGRAYFGPGAGPIHLDNVGCKGTESRLVDCPYDSTPNCVHAEDAGVVCTLDADNAAPVFATTATQSVAENTTAVVELAASDADGDTVTFALAGGDDETAFELSAAKLAFRNAPDYENHADADGDGVYEVTVSASDGQGGTASLAIRVTVLDVDEGGSNAAPVFETTAAQSVAENTTAVVELAASDPDGDAVTFALAGGDDQAAFELSAAKLAFRNAPDYENHADADGDGVYEVTVQASDGRGGTAALAMRVKVTDVDEGGGNAAPVFTTTAAQTVAENTTAVVELAATDPDGDSVTFALAGGADQAAFELSAAVLSFREAPDYESPGDDNGDRTYEVTVRASDGRGGTASLALLVTVTDVVDDGASVATGSLRLVDGATASEGRLEVYLHGQWGTVCDDLWGDVDATVACRQLGYADGEARVRAFFGEGTGPIHLDNVGCAGTESRLVDCPYDSTPNCVHAEDAGAVCAGVDANAAPAFTTAAAQSVAENETHVVKLAASDPNGDAVTFALTGGADQARFELSTANLSFKEAPDYETPGDANDDGVYEVTVQASDGRGGTAALAMRVMVTDVDEGGGNAAPVFTTTAAQTVAENTTAVVELAATDPDGDSVTFALAGGADEADFELTSAQLSFREAPDYETPGDANDDGVYEVTVQASDGRGGTASLALSVTVSDVFDEGSPPASGTLRLVGGTSASEGRVEVFLSGRWGTVCDDLWGDVDAGVACRQLGYAAGEGRIRAHFGPGTGPILLDNVGCVGTESRLVDCPYDSTPNCTHAEDAGVVCTDEE